MARGDYPSAKQDQYMVRFPDGMRDHLKAAAEKNKRSMNAEIISRIESSMFFEEMAENRRQADERDRLRREAGETVPNVPSWVKPPDSMDDYGEVRTIPPSEQQPEIDLANEAIQDAILKGVREAVKESMVPWVEAQAEGFQQWMLAAMESVRRTKADPEQVKIIKELRDQFIREHEAGLPSPPPAEPADGEKPADGAKATRGKK